jgi:hypothetical protein
VLSNTWGSSKYTETSPVKKEGKEMLAKSKKEKNREKILKCKGDLEEIYMNALQTRFMSYGVEAYVGKVEEAKAERVMNCRALMELMASAGLVKTEEDKELLLEIVERHMDPDSTYRGAKDQYLKRRPVLMMKTNSTFGVKSHYRGKEEEIMDASSAGYQTGEGFRRTLRTEGDKDELISIRVNGEPNSESKETRMAALQSSGLSESKEVGLPTFSVEQSKMKEAVFSSLDERKSGKVVTEKAMRTAKEGKQGIYVGEAQEADEEELAVRYKLFDKELADALNQTLGSGLLFFEFIECLVIYCYSKVRIGLIG